MAQRTFTVGLPEELLVAVEKAAERSGLTRNGWVRRTLETALLENGTRGSFSGVSALSEAGEASAPPRASEMTPEEKDWAYRERRMRR